MSRSFGEEEVHELQTGAHGAGAAAFGNNLHDFICIPDDGPSQVVDRCSLKNFRAERR